MARKRTTTVVKSQSTKIMTSLRKISKDLNSIKAQLKRKIRSY